MTVGDLRRRMSAAEFQAWYEFSTLEPLPDARADVHSARHLAMLANIYRNREEHPEPFGVGEFLPRWGDDGERESGGDGEARLLEFAQMWAATGFGTMVEGETPSQPPSSEDHG